MKRKKSGKKTSFGLQKKQSLNSLQIIQTNAKDMK